ncbi:MAG: RIP metalloprotease RseP [Lachnospiraceae bacterium]|nr:RIP metalloprotease RseP [Lachnospiraceae bacterium]
MTLILFVLIFGVVVLSHEFGHFIIAKLNGIHVVEFSVGMGPTLFSFKRKETVYALKLLPIGGACMFEGEDGLELKKEQEEGDAEATPVDDSGSFLKANVWSRIATVVAGPLFNFILAFVFAIILVSLSPKDLPQVYDVVEGSAAQEAGLKAGDTIVSIDGEKMYLFRDISLTMAISKGEALEIVYEREGQKNTTTLTPKLNESTGTYALGVYGGVYEESEGIEVFRDAWHELRYWVRSTYKSLGMLITGNFNRQDVAGPVGIAVNVVGKTYEEAKQYGVTSVVLSMMNIVVLLSVNLGILNLLPLPALDGGRLVFMLIELVRGKPVPPEKEGIVHFIGMVFFLGLMVVVLFNDLVNIFG